MSGIGSSAGLYARPVERSRVYDKTIYRPFLLRDSRLVEFSPALSNFLSGILGLGIWQFSYTHFIIPSFSESLSVPINFCPVELVSPSFSAFPFSFFL